MKLKPDITLMELGGDFVAVPVGEAAETLHGIIRLNETGKLIWDALAEGLDATQIAQRLTENYEVDRDTALNDVNAVVQNLLELGILEP